LLDLALGKRLHNVRPCHATPDVFYALFRGSGHCSEVRKFSMQALKTWPMVARRGIIGVLTDIDDTLTTASAIPADALAALAGGRAAGDYHHRPTGRLKPAVRAGLAARPPHR
jgi:hypothetical protein